MRELTYRYRLYPTAKQASEIRRTCGCARFLYNKLLEDRTRHYKETGEWKKIDSTPYQALPFMICVDPGVLSWVQNSLETAYRKFFYALNTKPNRYRPECIRRAEADPNYVLMDIDLMNYPRFKKKKTSKESYTTYIRDLDVKENRVLLPSIGRVKIRMHRPLPQDAEQICCTVLKKPCGHFYLLIRLSLPDIPEKKELEQPVGIVYVRGQLAVRSDGVPVSYRHQDEKLTRRINMAYKALKRRTPGSRGYIQTRTYLNKLFEHRVNQRRDDLHKAARQITNAGDAFYLQQPDVTNQLGQLTEKTERALLLDEAWYTFGAMIKYKAQGEGKRFWTVTRSFPIYGICSCCGHKPPAQENGTWHCPKCKFKTDQHLNAAGNLRNLGIQYIVDQKGFS